MSQIDELRRVASGDWIKNRLSAPLGILNLLAMEESEMRMAKDVLAADPEAKEILTTPFKKFTEQYKGKLDHYTVEEIIADPECAKLIDHIEKELLRIHEYLVRLEQDPRTHAFSDAENFVATKLHEMIQYAREGSEIKIKKEPTNEVIAEKEELEALIDQNYEEHHGGEKKM